MNILQRLRFGKYYLGWPVSAARCLTLMGINGSYVMSTLPPLRREHQDENAIADPITSGCVVIRAAICFLISSSVQATNCHRSNAALKLNCITSEQGASCIESPLPKAAPLRCG
jgi:hypothetical protein